MSAREALPEARRHLAFKIALTMTLAEILLVAAIAIQRAGNDAPALAGLFFIGLKSLPLLLLLPGLLRGSAKAAIWLCFLLCFYFLGAVLSVMEPPPLRWLGLADIAVIATGFTAALLAARPAPPASHDS